MELEKSLASLTKKQGLTSRRSRLRLGSLLTELRRLREQVAEGGDAELFRGGVRRHLSATSHLKKAKADHRAYHAAISKFGHCIDRVRVWGGSAACCCASTLFSSPSFSLTQVLSDRFGDLCPSDEVVGAWNVAESVATSSTSLRFTNVPPDVESHRGVAASIGDYLHRKGRIKEARAILAVSLYSTMFVGRHGVH
jgi:hypothetical protein